MTDADALLAAVLDRPDDDLPRLVYADWLGEHGEVERAEFIRLSFDPLTADRRRREFSRLQELGRQLFPGFRLWYGERDRRMMTGDDSWLDDIFPDSADRPKLLIDRGFAVEFAGPSAAWLAHGDAVLAAHPVRTVRLTVPFPRAGSLGEYNRFLPDDWCGAASLTAPPRLFYNGRPFRDWTDVGAVSLELHCRVDERGLPLPLSDRDLQMELLRRRWSGITFELPPEPAAAPWVGDGQFYAIDRTHPAVATAAGRPG